MSQKTKFKLVLKRLLITALCVSSITSAVVSAIPLAKADTSSTILGTNAALGSPVLNKDFVIDDWNKWEMICWGAFLSNFCIPLLDDYESAFKSGAGGTNGAGYAALCFGSGSDPANNEVIKQLCDEAIKQQKLNHKQIFVTYTTIENGVVTKAPDPNVDASKLREARFKDFFFQDDGDDDETYATYLNEGNVFVWGYYTHNIDIEDYDDIASLSDGAIPTFYIKNAKNRYVKIWDYTNSWDVQMIAAMLNSIYDEEYYDDFSKAFDNAWSSSDSSLMTLDAFGNIMCNNKMLIPASVNQHITKQDSINLINSFVMNSYVSTYSREQLILSMKTDSMSSIPFWDNSWDRVNGVPALSDSGVSNIGLLYYDLDNVVLTNARDNKSLNYGDLLLDLFSCDISNESNPYQLRFEISTDGFSGKIKLFAFNDASPLNQTKLAATLISNSHVSLENKTPSRQLTYILNTDGKKAQLFSTTPVVISTQLNTSTPSNEVSDQGTVRMFYNFLYEAYTGKSNYLTPEALKSRISGTNWHDFKNIEVEGDSGYGGMLDMFKQHNPKYKKAENVAGFWNAVFDANNNDSMTNNSNRVILAYPVSEVMKSVSSILSIDDHTEFSVYSTMIYMTYLDWYEISATTKLTVGTEKTSAFDPEIFDDSSDVLNIDLGSVIDTHTKEEREREVLNLGYLMLSPEEGREYRKNLIFSGIEDFVYEQYNRIVYGGANSMYSGTASKSNSGFLAISTFDSNPFTAWFLNSYVDISIILIMGLVLAIIVIGLLKKRKISWYFLNVLITVNVILLVPSSGEIVPYITSNFIQEMFTSKMTYWSISEGVTNAKLEKDTVENKYSVSGLSDEEAQLVMDLVKQLSVVYTDRSLMLKQDISQKLTQSTEGIYDDVQNYQSARWLLPMLMQQFTGDDMTEEYLYIKLSNAWDDMSNLYWYYDPEDAKYVTYNTATSKQSGDAVATSSGDATKDSASYSNLDRIPDWVEFSTTLNGTKNNINYRSFSYSLHPDNSELVHKYAWALGYQNDSRNYLSRELILGTDGSSYVNTDTWQLFINKANSDLAANVHSWYTSKEDTGFEHTADEYRRTDRLTMSPDYSYLKITESPIYYFFYVVKDSMESDKALGNVIYRIQGTVEKDSSGKEVRNSFMHATITPADQIMYEVSGNLPGMQYTGYVRDILDLEELFTNVIPYLYQVQLTSGGFDGKSGILGEAKITDLQYYEGQLQSWMYRCNWATKIIENPEYTKPCYVKDSDGNEYYVNNPVLTECYPDSRPMVFSEAQMHAYGLTEADMSLVELKCMEVNNDTCDEWTLLLNYAGTPGITKEVLLRQMATDATMIFNTEFSSAGILNSIYKMYPTSIDLRYLSFDSIMKMLMLNVSKNTSYVYGNTMQTLIADSDLFTAILLLLDALVCAALIPLMRNVLMAMIFYMGFCAIIQALFSDGKTKANIACGQIISNVLFMAYTLVYYACFCIMMAISSSDEVLSVKQVSAQPGSPILVLILVLLFSCVYVWVLFKHIKFCFQNYKDMGYAAYSMIGESIAEKVSGGMAKISDTLSNWVEGGSSESGGTGNTNSIKGSGRTDSGTQDVRVKSSDKAAITLENNGSEEFEGFEDLNQQVYRSGDIDDYVESTTSYDIDAQIDEGRNL